MDFLPLIVGIIIAIAIGASKNKKRQADGGTSMPHGENFPFPKEFAEMFGLEIKDEDQRTIEDRTAGIEELDAEQEGVAMTVAQYKERSDRRVESRVAIVADAPMEIDHSATDRQSFNFDIRQAIIFSEILKPKYNDNF